METRTIVSVLPEMGNPGHFVLDLSDNSIVKVGSFIDSPEGIRVEIRDNETGELTGDGPLLTDDVRAQFVALGVEGIPTHTVVELHPEHEQADEPAVLGAGHVDDMETPVEHVLIPVGDHAAASNDLANLRRMVGTEFTLLLDRIERLLGIVR